MKTFASLDEFAEFFTVRIYLAEAAASAALAEAAEIVEVRAKYKPGHTYEYWPPLAEITILDKIKRGFPVPSPLLRTGEHLRDTIEKTVTDDEFHVGSDSLIAFWQELGTSHIPPRSFLGTTMQEASDEIVPMITRRYTQTLNGE